MARRKPTPSIVVAPPGTPSGAIKTPKKKTRRRKDNMFSPALGSLICNEVATGLSRKAVAGKVGITPLQLSVWLKASGEGELLNDELNFYEEFTIAEAEGQAAHEGHFMNLARDKAVASANVRAQELFLSRRYPEDWNPKTRVEHTGTNGGPITAAVLHGTVLDFLKPAHDRELEDRKDKFAQLKQRTVNTEGHVTEFGSEDPLASIRAEIAREE